MIQINNLNINIIRTLCSIVFIFSVIPHFAQETDQQDFDAIANIKEVVKVGEFSKASKSLDSILELNPKNIYALELKASIYANYEKDFLKALEYYKKYNDINPDNALVLTNIGKNYCKIDSISLGKEYINKAFIIDPDNEYILLQYAYFVLEDTDEKIKAYEKAILEAKLKHEFGHYVYEESLRDIHNNIGYNLYLKKEFVKSATFLIEGLKYGNENSDHFNNLGNSLQRLNYLEQAINYYNQALKIEPNKPFSLNGKANSYQKLGVIDSSCVYWKKTLENGYKFKPEWREVWDIEDPEVLISKFCND